MARELAKCINKATMGTYLEMLRVVKFVPDTQQFLPQTTKSKYQKLESTGICSNDWAEETKTRISVTGFIVYLMGVPACCRSKAKKIM
jgi:hypothetical protein